MIIIVLLVVILTLLGIYFQPSTLPQKSTHNTTIREPFSQYNYLVMSNSDLFSSHAFFVAPVHDGTGKSVSFDITNNDIVKSTLTDPGFLVINIYIKSDLDNKNEIGDIFSVDRVRYGYNMLIAFPRNHNVSENTELVIPGGHLYISHIDMGVNRSAVKLSMTITQPASDTNVQFPGQDLILSEAFGLTPKILPGYKINCWINERGVVDVTKLKNEMIFRISRHDISDLAFATLWTSEILKNNLAATMQSSIIENVVLRADEHSSITDALLDVTLGLSNFLSSSLGVDDEEVLYSIYSASSIFSHVLFNYFQYHPPPTVIDGDYASNSELTKLMNAVQSSISQIDSKFPPIVSASATNSSTITRVDADLSKIRTDISSYSSNVDTLQIAVNNLTSDLKSAMAAIKLLQNQVATLSSGTPLQPVIIKPDSNNTSVTYNSTHEVIVLARTMFTPFVNDFSQLNDKMVNIAITVTDPDNYPKRSVFAFLYSNPYRIRSVKNFIFATLRTTNTDELVDIFEQIIPHFVNVESKVNYPKNDFADGKYVFNRFDHMSIGAPVDFSSDDAPSVLAHHVITANQSIESNVSEINETISLLNEYLVEANYLNYDHALNQSIQELISTIGAGDSDDNAVSNRYELFISHLHLFPFVYVVYSGDADVRL